MKKKMYIYICVIALFTIGIFCFSFVFNRKSKLSDFQEPVLFQPSSLETVHAEFELLDEKITMEINQKSSGVQFSNSLGTYVIAKNFDADFDFYTFKQDNEWFVKKMNCENKELCDVSKIYWILSSLIQNHESRDSVISYKLTKEETNTIQTILNLFSQNEYSDHASWNCSFKIIDTFIESVSCEQKNEKIFSVNFSQYNAIDKSKLLRIIKKEE